LRERWPLLAPFFTGSLGNFEERGAGMICPS
jgi:hypothetical protein